MISSVKFLDPTVRSIEPLSGFDWIRLSLVSVPVSALVLDVSSSSPHAATANASAQAANSANRARRRGLVLIGGGPPSCVSPCRFGVRRKPMRSGPYEADL